MGEQLEEKEEERKEKKNEEKGKEVYNTDMCPIFGGRFLRLEYVLYMSNGGLTGYWPSFLNTVSMSRGSSVITIHPGSRRR